MAPHHETIYVALLDQGPDAWRPVLAARRAEGLFEILSRNDDPDSEAWQFPPGGLVRCETRVLAGRPCLVAVALEPPRTPRRV